MFFEIAALAAKRRHQFKTSFFYDPFLFQPSTLLQPTGRRVRRLTEFLMTEESRSIHSRALPNYEKAEIIRSKLEAYVLNPANDAGKHKARVFKSALGFDQSNWELLKQRILNELPYHEAKPEQRSQWGYSYVVDLLVEGPNGNIAEVRTAWLFRPGVDFPSLITLYVLKEKVRHA